MCVCTCVVGMCIYVGVDVHVYVLYVECLYVLGVYTSECAHMCVHVCIWVWGVCVYGLRTDVQKTWVFIPCQVSEPVSLPL